MICSTGVSVRLGLQWPDFCRIVHVPFRVVHHEWLSSRHVPDCEKYVERMLSSNAFIHFLAGNVRHDVFIAHPTRVMWWRPSFCAQVADSRVLSATGHSRHGVYLTH
jgi:hypothetical protein